VTNIISLELFNACQIGLCMSVWYNADTHKMRIICGKNMRI